MGPNLTTETNRKLGVSDRKLEGRHLQFIALMINMREHEAIVEHIDMYYFGSKLFLFCSPVYKATLFPR